MRRMVCLMSVSHACRAKPPGGDAAEGRGRGLCTDDFQGAGKTRPMKIKATETVFRT